MKKRCIAAILACLGMVAGSCGLEKPDHADGRNTLVLQAIDTSGVYSDDWRGVPNAQVEVSSPTFVYKQVFETDEEGRLVLDGLPNGDYNVQASMRDDANNVLLIGQKGAQLRSEAQVEDTLFMSFVPVSPVVLNEIYYCGCNGVGSYYFDQYVELYNSTADTVYLDGYIMCRSTQVENLVDFEAVD